MYVSFYTCIGKITVSQILSTRILGTDFRRINTEGRQGGKAFSTYFRNGKMSFSVGLWNNVVCVINIFCVDERSTAVANC